MWHIKINVMSKIPKSFRCYTRRYSLKALALWAEKKNTPRLGYAQAHNSGNPGMKVTVQRPSKGLLTFLEKASWRNDSTRLKLLDPRRSWLASSVLRVFFLVEHCPDLYSTRRIIILCTRPSKWISVKFHGSCLDLRLLCQKNVSYVRNVWNMQSCTPGNILANYWFSDHSFSLKVS